MQIWVKIEIQAKVKALSSFAVKKTKVSCIVLHHLSLASNRKRQTWLFDELLQHQQWCLSRTEVVIWLQRRSCHFSNNVHFPITRWWSSVLGNLVWSLGSVATRQLKFLQFSCAQSRGSGSLKGVTGGVIGGVRDSTERLGCHKLPWTLPLKNLKSGLRNNALHFLPRVLKDLVVSH